MNVQRFDELKVLAAQGRSPELEDWKELTAAQGAELADIHREKGGLILDDEKNRTSLLYRQPPEPNSMNEDKPPKTNLLPVRLESADVEAWVKLPGRRIVWFHAVWDGPGALCLAAYRALPLAVCEIIPLRLVDLDSLEHPRFVQWDLRHASEIMIWESGRVLWRGVPQGGPGRNWAAWLEKWRPV